MRSFLRSSDLALSSPLLSDDVIEFHAARLLLLIAECGIDGTVDSLTKLAKLDFFVRYPSFLERIAAEGDDVSGGGAHSVESSMVRFKYGPWDHRYYQLLPYLEARGLICVLEKSKNIEFTVTQRGGEIADLLAAQPAFTTLIEQMGKVRRILGRKSGSAIKKIIYRTFANEVTNRSYGETIKQ